jgi:hypothetical protein
MPTKINGLIVCVFITFVCLMASNGVNDLNVIDVVGSRAKHTRFEGLEEAVPSLKRELFPKGRRAGCAC